MPELITPHRPKVNFAGGLKETHIVIFDDLIPPDLVERFYLFAEDAFPDLGNEGETLGGHLPDIKKAQDLRFSEWNSWTGPWHIEALREVGYDIPAMDAEMCAYLTDAINLYREQYPEITDAPFGDTGFQLQRYAKNEGFYTRHVDSNPYGATERVLACVIYLNAVEEGGETSFPLHDVSVEPRAGRLILFPATWTHPHESCVPVSDDKYIISTFITVIPE